MPVCIIIQLLFGGLADGGRSVGGRMGRFGDTLKASLKSFDIDINTWDKVAVGRPAWRSLTWKGCQMHEERRTAGAKKSESCTGPGLQAHQHQAL